MTDLEIPIGKRRPLYRFFEILPAVCSYAAVILLVVLSLVNPVLSAIYLLVIIITTLVKAVGIAYRTIGGHNTLKSACRVNWSDRLTHLENPHKYYDELRNSKSSGFEYDNHIENLRLISAAEPGFFPKPSQIYNAVIIATYNESIDVLIPTIKSLQDTTYPNDHLVVVLAYEERGGSDTEKRAKDLQKKFKNTFKDFLIVKHPDGIKNEVIGKGGNITYAGRYLKEYFTERGIKYSDVIITTLDSDNRPYKSYFDYVTYEYICHEDRKHLSYQPVSLFMNNIWDAPAPMRVIATGNSFWNIISSMRPHSLRNFASHSQPMDALVEMDFWSTRTIVEDGHQYWRSYFHFDGNYSVLPIHVPIYQDAVLSHTFRKTLVAQFIQVRRWDYGASDVPYVATRILSKKRTVPFWSSITKLVRLIDGHVTLASVALIVAFGGWVPLLLNPSSSRSMIAHQLPIIISWIQTIAMLGLFVTIILSIRMLPKRPERYKKRRSFSMVVQWLLMPVTSILYNSAAAYYSQTRLALGKYIEKFDVTEKVVYSATSSANRAKKTKVAPGASAN